MKHLISLLAISLLAFSVTAQFCNFRQNRIDRKEAKVDLLKAKQAEKGCASYDTTKQLKVLPSIETVFKTVVDTFVDWETDTFSIRDTVYQDKIRLINQWKHDTLIQFVKCPGDTVVVQGPVETIYKTKESEWKWHHWLAFIICLLIILRVVLHFLPLNKIMKN